MNYDFRIPNISTCGLLDDIITCTQGNEIKAQGSFTTVNIRIWCSLSVVKHIQDLQRLM